jgi:hypothetical protein
MNAPFQITTSGEAISVASLPDAARTITRAELTAVVVEIHMTGDRVTDVWWLLYGRPGEVALRVPQGAPGEEALVQWLMTLPRFDIDTLMQAMRFHGNGTFEIWRAAART